MGRVAAVSRGGLAGSSPTRVANPRPCPVCSSTDQQLLYRQQFESFERGSIGDGYDVVACARCGMCFASGLPSHDRFAQYYADSSKYDLSGEGATLSARDVDRYADQARFVAASVPDRTAPVLDVGTATGGFLGALREIGFERLAGVDPSPDAVHVARDAFGLDVRVGGLAEAGVLGDQFALISYVAVLEHVLDPREQLRAVARLLQPGGHLFVSVPAAASFKDHARAPFQEFSVEHINYFTSRSLANAMGAEGYSRVDERVIVLPFGTDGLGPALEAIYRRDGVVRPLQEDGSGPDDVREYILRSERAETAVIRVIDDLASSGRPIYVWGTGTHTLHLLRTSRLADCEIVAFLDSNPHYVGGTLIGRPVLAPSQLGRVDAPILVSSAVSQSGIAAAARERFGRDVQLLLLYGGDDAPK